VSVDPLYVFYGCAALAVILAVEALYLVFRDTRNYRTRVNRRLQIAASEADREKVLVQLRRERGLDVEGGARLRLRVLQRLIVQSGVKLAPLRIALTLTLLAAGAAMAAWFVRGKLDEALIAGAVGATVLPLVALIVLRKRRLARFAAQLPEAIDIIVRSLRAGHPVPAAIAMVARELPDPVGTEFGMVADEITYGADLETALRAMMARSGQDDLPLFVTSVAIQTSTGGNLSQILENLSKVIRERFKMRRKVRGLSAEGRMSALILNATPFIVFAIVNVIAPDFYGEVWDKPLTKIALGGAVSWMVVGNLMMRRMINFKI
jgi:tight adherence protein B